MDITTLLIIGAAALAAVVVALLLRRLSWGSSPGYTELTPRRVPLARLDPAAEGELRRLVAGGQKIAAIKRVRELTGMGLKEAKDYVESLPAAAPGPASADAPAAVARGPAIAPAADPEVRALLAGGNKIAAIKRVRELTGMGLKEAKDYVEAWAPTLPDLAAPTAPAAQPAAAAADPEVRALLAGGNKIAAIKRVRELTGMGLKEAKDYVEALERQDG